MKSFLKIIFAVVTLFLTYNSFAANDTLCPPVSRIMNTTLIMARKGGNSYWHIISEDFHYGEKEWNFFYSLELTQATTPDEALQQGTVLLKKAKLPEASFDPNPAIPGGGECMYHGDDGEYEVNAFSPPLHLPLH